MFEEICRECGSCEAPCLCNEKYYNHNHKEEEVEMKDWLKDKEYCAICQNTKMKMKKEIEDLKEKLINKDMELDDVKMSNDNLVEENNDLISILESRSKEKKYMPTLSELIDRLSITQLKEWFIPEYKDEYSWEIQEILHDIDMELDQKEFDSNFIRAVIVLALINLNIWHNESEVRKGSGNGDLELTHGLNGIRNTAKNKIQEYVGGRKDYKVDCLAAEFEDWKVSW